MVVWGIYSPYHTLYQHWSFRILQATAELLSTSIMYYVIVQLPTAASCFVLYMSGRYQLSEHHFHFLYYLQSNSLYTVTTHVTLYLPPMYLNPL